MHDQLSNAPTLFLPQGRLNVFRWSVVWYEAKSTHQRLPAELQTRMESIFSGRLSGLLNSSEGRSVSGFGSDANGRTAHGFSGSVPTSHNSTIRGHVKSINGRVL